MVVNASRSVYQANRYIPLTLQVLAVAFCPSIDTRTLHRTVTTAKFSAAFLKNLDSRTIALITAINRAEASTASRTPRTAIRDHIGHRLDMCVHRRLHAALETAPNQPDLRLATLEKAMFPFFDALRQAAEEADNMRLDTSDKDDGSDHSSSSAEDAKPSSKQ